MSKRIFTVTCWLLAVCGLAWARPHHNLEDSIFTPATLKVSDKAVTPAEVRAMTEKVAAASALLDEFWQAEFDAQELDYRSPRVGFFLRSVQSPCGLLQTGGAYFCPRNNTIYADAVFLTRLMRATSAELESDGDLAPITVIAHEWGHAAQRQAGARSKLPVREELNADCLAGAFARYAQDQERLEEGDVEEAEFALSEAGDDAPWYAPGAHGSSEERVDSFRRGYENGSGACGIFRP